MLDKNHNNQGKLVKLKGSNALMIIELVVRSMKKHLDQRLPRAGDVYTFYVDEEVLLCIKTTGYLIADAADYSETTYMINSHDLDHIRYLSISDVTKLRLNNRISSKFYERILNQGVFRDHASSEQESTHQN